MSKMIQEVVSESKSFINDSKEIIKNRVANPFVFSFLISFLLYNWKSIVYFIFSDDKIDIRIDLASSYSNLWSLFIFPLLTAIIYVLIVPYVSTFIDKCLVLEKDIRSDINSDIEINVHYEKIESLKRSIELEKIEKELREYGEISDLIKNHRLELDNQTLIIQDLKRTLKSNERDNEYKVAILEEGIKELKIENEELKKYLNNGK